MKNKQAQKGNRGIKIFSIIVGIIYLATFLINNDLTQQSLLLTGKILIKSLPVFLLIFAVMILSNLFLTPERVKKHIGQEAGWKGWLYAMLFGILVAGPPYMLYPMLRDMKKHGLKTNYLAVFLYNRNVKIPFIPAMIYYFGWQYTVIMTILVVVFSIMSGMIMGKIIE